jgi:peptide/nickel transport system substrate-binding protein
VLVAFPFLLVAAVLVAMPSPPEAHADPAEVHTRPRPESERDVLRIGIHTLPRPTGGIISRGAFWGTTRTDPDGTRFAVLSEEVPAITNDSLRFLADGRLDVTWRLRPDLKWSDGEPLTAADLDFALQVSPDARIAEINVVSAREMTVRFKDRVAVALEEIAPMPRHALKEPFEKGGYDEVREYRRKHIIPSAGPYRVAEFAADDHAILETNPHFAGLPPSIPRIEIRRYKSDAALVKAFEKGAIDMIAPNAITPEAAQDLAQRKPDAVHIRPSEVLLFLHPDLDSPLLAKRAVRAALLLALDRDRLRTEVFGDTAGSAPIAHIPVPGALPAGTEQIGYDMEGARAELERLGAVGARMPLVHGPTPFDQAVVAHIVRDLAERWHFTPPKKRAKR